MNEVLLKAENITKSFPGVKALKNIHFELRKGEVHVLLGENGAGKSTLMKIFAGVYPMDTGRILMDGAEVLIDSPRKAQELGISIIYQELNLCKHLTVAQNIFIGREFTHYGMLNEKKLNEGAQKLLDSLHSDIKASDLVKDLTVSRQQMVEIAKAISVDSKIIIMDEPTSALSDKEIDELFSIIRRLKEQGKGIIYISHRLEELKYVADRVTVFRDGEHVDTLNYTDTNLDNLIRLMVGRRLEEKFPKINIPRGDKILEVRNINRGKILQDVSFELFKGEILGLAGLVGAGRTELGRAIFGADKIESGEVLLNGEKLNIKNPDDAIKNGIVYVPEDRKHDGLLLGMSVIENVTLPSIAEMCTRTGIIKKQKEEAATEKIRNDLKIKTPSNHQLIKNLSGGNQQKVAVGKWMLKSPKVFIFDEPTRGVDVGAKIEIYNILNALKEQGIGIIVISSELPEIIGITDRILVMCEGRIKGNLDTANATQEEIMYHATQFTGKL
ncbi:MAG: sugar ABC transporter ATP-binding protein [Caulobacteraceae bacterium]